ncbi:NYN domain-containing protein [Ruegeria lacuscaerulensis]|uniref:NYN domain-containing protein n=1 Tax=Ruegeria lacuscaerulensis TaxID=55218 RepID=UPI00147DB47F|nr:NYN domain-containing protein [Ruegeria lacuscaerulensis]
MTKRVAVLVDGDNLSADHRDAIRKIGLQAGRVDVARVYMNARRNSSWHEASAYHPVHSGSGKNATDLLMAIDAMDLALRQDMDVIVIASSDGDFVHLHRKLRELGVTTIGTGEAKTPESTRASSGQFFELKPLEPETPPAPPDEDMDCQIRGIIAANSKNGIGIRLTILGAKMHRQHGVQISTHPEKTWRRYLQSKPDLYDLDPAGQNAHVRFKPHGFAE